MLQSDFRKKDNPVIYVSGGIAAGGKIGLTGTATKLSNQAHIIGISLNVGGALPAGLLPINGAGGVSNTIIIGGKYKQ